MATFYSKLKAFELTCESKPIEALTKQNWNDSLFLIRGKDEGIPAWHYILVPYNKINDLKNHKSGQTIDCKKFGCVIQYRDNNGQIYPSSGWGINPTYLFKTWIENQYGDRSFDENTIFEYEKDDIRLCTIQRLTSDQLIGIYRYYNKQGHFHYIKLFDNYEKSLAYRGGIKNYDRLISINGINIEKDTLDEVTKHFNNQLNVPLEILVCSPSTYQYYKSNNIIIHSDLPTVQHLKPVFDFSYNQNELILKNYFNNQHFYVIQWENNKSISVVYQTLVFKSPDFIRINDICFIENQGKYQRGIIKFKGSKEQCEKNLIVDKSSFVYPQLISDINIKTMKKFSSSKLFFENLPNELLFDLFDYFKIEDLYSCFYNLNKRLNNILLFRSNISLIYNENLNLSLINLYKNQIKHLIIDTSIKIDLKLFPNLNSLIIQNRNLNTIKQIQPEILPNLIYLSFKLKFDFQPSNEFVDQIFSNQFSKINYINLGSIRRSINQTWLKCFSLKKLLINCDQLIIIEDILQSCPNLIHFQIHLLYKTDISINNSSLSLNSHQLQRFILTSEGFELTFHLIDYLFYLMSNIKRLYLQTKCRIPFYNLIEMVSKRLNYLIRFDCFIKEILMKNQRIENLNDIQQISSCFKTIQCIKENEQFRIFSTD